MKTRKLLIFLTLLLWIVLSQTLQAQTFHKTVTCTIDNCVIICLNRAVYGAVYYDFSYHIDKKTGKMNSLRWNAHGAEIYDSETGEKFLYMDTGIDNLGAFWDLWNNINAYNTGYPISYNVEDGWLDSVMPSVLPGEGTYVNTYKLIGKDGTKVSWTWWTQVHVNANGELTVEIIREKADCN